MMATSPLFSATFTTSHPHQTYIGPPSEFFLYSNTTNKSAFLSLPLPTSTMRYSTAAQPEPHHAPHTFHVIGQSYHTCTSSWGHGFWSPQGLARIWVSILKHPSEYKSFHATFTTSQLRWTCIGPLLEFFPYSDTTNKSAFLSLSLPTSILCYLPQHNQSPTMLHTCSMSQVLDFVLAVITTIPPLV